MNMDFGGNKTPVWVINEGAFGGTYCRHERESQPNEYQAAKILFFLYNIKMSGKTLIILRLIKKNFMLLSKQLI